MATVSIHKVLVRLGLESKSGPAITEADALTIMLVQMIDSKY